MMIKDLSPLKLIEVMTAKELRKRVRKLNVKRNNGYTIHVSSKDKPSRR